MQYGVFLHTTQIHTSYSIVSDVNPRYVGRGHNASGQRSTNGVLQDVQVRQGGQVAQAGRQPGAAEVVLRDVDDCQVAPRAHGLLGKITCRIRGWD